MSNLIYTNKKIYLEFELACLWIDISYINVLPPSKNLKYSSNLLY